MQQWLTVVGLAIVVVGGCAKKSQATLPPQPAPAESDPTGGVPGGVLVADPRTLPPVTGSSVAEVSVTQADLDRIAAVRDREGALLFRDPRWTAYLERGIEGATDEKEAFARGFVLGRTLSERGVARLPAARLARWSELRLRFAETSQQACAGLWTGEWPGDLHDYSLSRLSDDNLAEIMRINAEGGLAELDAKTPLAADPEALTLGLAALSDLLNPEDRRRFAAVLAGQANTPADHCFATKVLHGHASALAEPLRTRFLRAVAVSIAESSL